MSKNLEKQRLTRGNRALDDEIEIADGLISGYIRKEHNGIVPSYIRTHYVYAWAVDEKVIPERWAKGIAKQYISKAMVRRGYITDVESKKNRAFYTVPVQNRGSAQEREMVKS